MAMTREFSPDEIKAYCEVEPESSEIYDGQEHIRACVARIEELGAESQEQLEKWAGKLSVARYMADDATSRAEKAEAERDRLREQIEAGLKLLNLARISTSSVLPSTSGTLQIVIDGLRAALRGED